MFPRASRTLHICLRCQNRAKSVNSSTSYTLHQRWRNSQVTHHRWNSNAAALKEERDGDNETIESLSDATAQTGDDAGLAAMSKDATQPAEVNSEESHTGIDANDSNVYHDESDEPRRTSNTKFKHWRPPTMMAMDTNFLGQPGEILVLSEEGRKKRRRRQQSDDDNQEDDQSRKLKHELNGESVYETLKNESRPASEDEIMKSIDEIRNTLPLAGSHGPQSAPAKRLLEKSFSKSQLNVYIKNSPPKSAKVPIKAAPRAEFATYIVQHIWSLDGGKKGWHIPLSESLKELIRLVKQYHPLRLDLRSATETRDGFKGTIPSVRAKIEKLATEGSASKWFFKPSILTQDKSPSPEKSLINLWANAKIVAIARDQMVILRGGKSKSAQDVYKASAFSKSALRNFARELFLAYQATASFAQSLQPVDSINKGILLPAVNRDVTLEGEKHLRPKPCISTSNSGIEDLKTTQKGKLKKTLLEPSSQCEICTDLDFDISLRNRLSTVFSVEFGKVTARLFDLGNDDWRVQKIFSPHVPFLPQFLAKHGQLNTTDSSAGATANSTLDRLLFKPRGPSTLPSLEVYADLSESNSIAIKQINLQFPELTEMVSLPGLETDLHFSRQESFTLFTRDEPVQERFASLIGNIAEQLPFAHERGNMYDPGNININYLMDLDFSVLKASHDPTGKKQIFHYALEKAQIVQSFSPTSPESGSATLEHVSRTARFRSLLSYESQKAEILRMTEAHGRMHSQLPLSDPTPAKDHIERDAEKFEAFVNNAFKMASRISEFSMLKSQEIASRYPKFD